MYRVKVYAVDTHANQSEATSTIVVVAKNERKPQTGWIFNVEKIDVIYKSTAQGE